MNFSRAKTLDVAKGRYDGFLVLPEPRDFDAELTVPDMGRRLVVSSNQAGVQVFTHPGGTLPAPEAAPDIGAVEHLPEAVCLEPQVHPDAPNHEGFPSILLPARQTYENRIRYQLEW